MGHAPSKETLNQLRGLLLEGVLPVNDELGRGAYGVVFTVRYVPGYVRMFTDKLIRTPLLNGSSGQQ